LREAVGSRDGLHDRRGNGAVEQHDELVT
jgi:hypothetical protein